MTRSGGAKNYPRKEARFPTPAAPFPATPANAGHEGVSYSGPRAARVIEAEGLPFFPSDKPDTEEGYRAEAAKEVRPTAVSTLASRSSRERICSL